MATEACVAVCELCGGPNADVLRNGARACAGCRAALAPTLSDQQKRRLEYLLGAGRELQAFHEGLLPVRPVDSSALRLVSREEVQ